MIRFYVWRKDDIGGEQSCVLTYNTLVEAERAAAALQRVARHGRTFFVTTIGEEMEIDGSLDVQSHSPE